MLLNDRVQLDNPGSAAAKLFRARFRAPFPVFLLVCLRPKLVCEPELHNITLRSRLHARTVDRRWGVGRLG